MDPLLALVVSLILIEYVAIASAVGWARGRYGVRAPATTGHEVFERYYRVQTNTVEQLVVHLPALFLFAAFVSARGAAAAGLLFLIGRAVYFRSYVADPAKRGLGFGLGFVANAILVLGTVGAAVRQLL